MVIHCAAFRRARLVNSRSPVRHQSDHHLPNFAVLPDLPSQHSKTPVTGAPGRSMRATNLGIFREALECARQSRRFGREGGSVMLAMRGIQSRAFVGNDSTALPKRRLGRHRTPKCCARKESIVTSRDEPPRRFGVVLSCSTPLPGGSSRRASGRDHPRSLRRAKRGRHRRR